MLTYIKQLLYMFMYLLLVIHFYQIDHKLLDIHLIKQE